MTTQREQRARRAVANPNDHNVAHTELVKLTRLALGLEPDLALFLNSNAFVEQWDERTGAVKKFRTGLCAGCTDIVGLIGPRGRWFCLEAKTGGGEATPEQRMFMANVRRLGGFAAIFHSVAEAKAALARARRGESQ